MYLAFILYALILFGIVLASYKKHTNETDFVLGSRSINFWVTAISAHASDMSSWLLMAFPAVIFLNGMIESWIAIGLIVFMFLNWHYLAPKLRLMTEKYGSLTLSSYLESRFHDHTGFIRISTALISLLFFTFYISAGLVGLGYVFELAFHIPYSVGIIIGIIIAILYTVIGGYVSVAWTDFFQGLFLLAMIILVPFVAFHKVGDFGTIIQVAKEKGISLLPIPSKTGTTLLKILFFVFGWGPGYFGQPHILTKFMGIKNPNEMYKAKYIGIIWQILAMAAAVFVGVVSIAYFKATPNNPELVFVIMTKELFTPFFAGLILCAILAATTSTMESQILVQATLLSEDFYKRLFRPKASSKELLWVSRAFVVVVALLAFFIAYGKVQSIYSLVLYSWSGLGAAFGPIILLSLHSKRVNRHGAVAAIIVGGMVAALWRYVNHALSIDIPELIPAFILSTVSALVFSYFSRHKVPFPHHH